MEKKEVYGLRYDTCNKSVDTSFHACVKYRLLQNRPAISALLPAEVLLF